MPGLNADVREPKTEAKHYIGESVREEHVIKILFLLLWGYGRRRNAPNGPGRLPS
jgi:hypothetical protein